jgi:hypothetical protein
MFPVFPALFPVCSHSRPVDSLRSQCSGFPGLTSMDALPSSLPYIQQPGTLGTEGTGLKRHELGLAPTRNRRGTLGTSHRIHSAFTRATSLSTWLLNSVCGSVCPVSFAGAWRRRLLTTHGHRLFRATHFRAAAPKLLR